jgi:hypothetical protein
MKKLYPVCDNVSLDELEALGFKKGETSGKRMASLGMPVTNVMAVRTGEYRNPLKGEWYLSGAIPSAYRAPNNFISAYYILKLVRVKTETRIVIVPT